MVAEAVKALNKVAEVYGHTFEFKDALIGGAAIDATGNPLQTYEASRQMKASYEKAALLALVAITVVLMLERRIL